MVVDRRNRTNQACTPKLVEAWQTAVLRIRPFVVAAALWERVLTDADRRRVGDDLEGAYQSCQGTAGMWMRLRGVSSARNCRGRGGSQSARPAHGAWLLRTFGEASGEPETDRDSAIASGALVLSEQPREAHWDNQRIAEVDWDRRTPSVDFFLGVVSARQSGFGRRSDSVCRGCRQRLRCQAKIPAGQCRGISFRTLRTKSSLPAAACRSFVCRRQPFDCLSQLRPVVSASVALSRCLVVSDPSMYSSERASRWHAQYGLLSCHHRRSSCFGPSEVMSSSLGGTIQTAASTSASIWCDRKSLMQHRECTGYHR